MVVFGYPCFSQRQKVEFLLTGKDRSELIELCCWSTGRPTKRSQVTRATIVLCADMFRLAPVIYHMDVVREHGKNMTGNKRVLRDKEELA